MQGPVRIELEVLALEDGLSTADREWAQHGNNAVHIPNMGQLDESWTMSVGGTVLIRGKGGGWYMVDLQRDDHGYFAMCVNTRVPIEWNEKRRVWVSTVRA